MTTPHDSQSSSVTAVEEAGRYFRLVFLNGRRIAVYNIEGAFYATQAECTHAGGPLSKGDLDGKVITCPWHASCFDVTDGSVVCGPAEQPLKTFSVTIHGEIGRVEIKA